MNESTPASTARPTGAVPEYGFAGDAPSHTVRYLHPQIERLLPRIETGGRALDLGCGNGSNAEWLASMGGNVVGIDASRNGIAIARQQVPDARFEAMEIGPDLCRDLNEEPFDLVLSTEVVEHLYAPRDWARGAFDALRPGGIFISSTPYHGYLKNLVLSCLDKWDSHLNPLWDGGHIKFWSKSTLSRLLFETGFETIRFRGAGRAPYIWMSMVMAGQKPVGSCP